MYKEEIAQLITDFMWAIQELTRMGFDMQKNDAETLIFSAFELMHITGCDQNFDDEQLYKIIMEPALKTDLKNI